MRNTVGSVAFHRHGIYFTYLFIYIILPFSLLGMPIPIPNHYSFHFIVFHFFSFFNCPPFCWFFVAQLGFCIESQWVYFILLAFNECNSKSTQSPLLGIDFYGFLIGRYRQKKTRKIKKMSFSMWSPFGLFVFFGFSIKSTSKVRKGKQGRVWKWTAIQ